MKERPILFSGPMVRAILDGKKTQTRRIFKGEAFGVPESICRVKSGLSKAKLNRLGVMFLCDSKPLPIRTFTPCPYGGIGDRLWVRENYGICWEGGGFIDPVINYRADSKQKPIMMKNGLMEKWREFYGRPRKNPWDPHKWYPSIFMPRFASRIILEITNIRVERLQDISDSDARDEGVELGDHWIYTQAFEELWDTLNAKTYPWSSNPWVWVVDFKKG